MNLIILYIFLIIVIFAILGAKFDFKKVGFFKSFTITIIIVATGIFIGILPMYVGKCGDKAWYTYNIYNTARIYGKGKVSLNSYENSDVIDGVLASYSTPTHLIPDKLKKVIIKKGITELDTAAFASYQNLEEIKLSNTVSSIGNASFSHCNNLRKIDNLGNVNYIGSRAFMYCENLKELYIPSGVTEIKDYTFYNCGQLSQITLHDNIAGIEQCAFYNCTSLQSIQLPNKLKKIGSYAFENCTSLKEITIPESVTIIEKRPFYRCTKLKDIYIIEKSNENDDKWDYINIDDDSKIELGGSSDIVIHWDN